MAPTIVLLGPPGSGKGTQAVRLHDSRGFVLLATGDLIREERANGTELGRRVETYVESGHLVPDEVVVDIVREALRRIGDEPVLLDGFPRNVAQAEALDGILGQTGRALEAVVYVDVPDAVVAERIRGRHQGRHDDDPETVKERLRVYHHATEPLVAHYRERGLLRRVDGAQGPDAVEAAIRSALA